MTESVETSQRDLAVGLIECHGIMRLSDLKRRGINPATLARLVDEGILHRSSRGLYERADADVDISHSLAEVATRVPKGAASYRRSSFMRLRCSFRAASGSQSAPRTASRRSTIRPPGLLASAKKRSPLASRPTPSIRYLSGSSIRPNRSWTASAFATPSKKG
ncbi:hypothetical protein MPLA_670065 [Mesorhizobium sp. ORS 3359]|nr:hypothetical protein MPLA_670065 [Mesorhizobium sp. ORS 3359]